MQHQSREPDPLVDEVHALIAQFHDTGNRRFRDRAIERAMPLAERLARRFDGRGEDPADLRQVAMLGLVNAVDRFDAEYTNGFIPYAVTTIMGELKRHFRDRTWALKVPRPIKERALLLRAATEALEHRHIEVTAASLAAETSMTQEEVLEALEGYDARLTASLDAPAVRGDADSASLGDLIGSEDASLETAIDLVALAPAISRLTDRERLLIELRFRHELSQSDIGERLGVSQMQVSRLLRAVCEKLRKEFD